MFLSWKTIFFYPIFLLQLKAGKYFECSRNSQPPYRLFFTQIHKVGGKIVKVIVKKVYLDTHDTSKLLEVFIPKEIWRSHTNSFHAFLSISVIVSVKFESFINDPIYDPLKISTFIFSALCFGSFFDGKRKQFPFFSRPFTNCFDKSQFYM